MEFKEIDTSVIFEFQYGPYLINIADYVDPVQSRTPEGKISVLIEKYGDALSSKSVERLVAYIQQHINGVCVACEEGMIEVNLHPHDQFMMTLLSGLNVLFPM